jgi:glycosyltransferase EpsF
MRIIKVLHILPEINGGGIERFLLNYYSEMDKNIICFDFVKHVKMKGILEDDFIKLGSRIYYVPSKKSNLFNYGYGIYKIIKSDNYDIVHVHQNFHSWPPLLLAKFLRVKTRISHSHNFIFKESALKKGVNKINRFFIKKTATDFFACTKEAALWLYGQKLIDSNEINIIKNAIEIDDFIFNKDIRDKKRIELEIKDKICLGHVGRFFKQKNHNFLIDIFNEVHKLNKNTILILAGNGDLFEDVKKKVNVLKLNNCIRFLGVRKDVNELYQTMDLFVLPSIFEGLGIVAIEAQASGLKCFVSDILPKDVNVSSDIEFLSINKSPKYWAKKIIKNIDCGLPRNDNKNTISNTGYSIKEAVKYLELLYIQSVS